MSLTRLRDSVGVLIVLAMVWSGATVCASGRIEGRVTRADGSGVGGVTVSIGGTTPAVLTDADGRFRIDGVKESIVTVTLALGTSTDVVDAVAVDGVAVLNRTVDWTTGYAETITVRAASRRNERLLEAPASVAVVDAVATAAAAPTGQAPLALTSVPGVEITQSGVFDFNLNIRGLNGALTRRVLTLIDGRDASSVLIGAQEWAAFAMPLDNIEHIEVVRGPGSALYGANAFNGVVDITSKQPRDEQGGQADFSAGEIDTAQASVRYAGALGPHTYYRTYASGGRTRDFYVSRTTGGEYAGLPPEVRPLARDSTARVMLGARLDRYLAQGQRVTAEGGWTRTEGSVFVTSAGRLQNTGVQRPWFRSAFDTSRTSIRGYVDGRYGEMASLSAGNTIFDRSMKTSVEGQQRFTLPSSGQALVGAAYRFLRADTRDPEGRPTILRGLQRAHEQAVFGQVEQPWAGRLRLVLSARVDRSSLHHAEVSPKAAVVLGLAPTHSVRVTYGRAFETGSFVHYFTRTAAAPPVSLAAVETALRPALGDVALGFGAVPVLALGNENLEVERVRTLDTGYSGVIARRVLIGANYYYNRVSNLITPLLPQVGSELGRINPTFGAYRPPSSLTAGQQAVVLATLRGALPASLFATMSNDLDGTPIFAVASYTNFDRVTVQGAEASVQFWFAGRAAGDVGYSALKFSPDRRLTEPLISANAPSQKVTAGLSYSDKRWGGGVRYRWADTFYWNGGVFHGQVPAASVVDVTARYALGPRTSLQANVTNLLDNSHYEIFGGDLIGRRALASIVQRW